MNEKQHPLIGRQLKITSHAYQDVINATGIVTDVSETGMTTLVREDGSEFTASWALGDRWTVLPNNKQ
jgi:hypothetical protein